MTGLTALLRPHRWLAHPALVESLDLDRVRTSALTLAVHLRRGFDQHTGGIAPSRRPEPVERKVSTWDIDRLQVGAIGVDVARPRSIWG